MAAGAGGALSVMLVEGGVDAAEDDFQGNTRFAPVSISAQSSVESISNEPRAARSGLQSR